MKRAQLPRASVLRHPAILAATLAQLPGLNRTGRTMRILLFAGILPLFLTSFGHAQTIYSDTFNGAAVNVNQRSPNFAANDAGAASSAIWRDVANSKMLFTNGSVNTAEGDSALLPFTPEDGYVYTLTASVTFTGDPGPWVGAGFAENYAYAANGNSQFNESGVTGYNWAILSEDSGKVQHFTGPSGVGQIYNQDFVKAGPGTHTLTLVLDTTSAQWVISCYVDGRKAGSDYTYQTQPDITAVGLTQHTLSAPSAVHWNSFTLQATGRRTTNPVDATVSFSGTGVPLNPAFVGLSYEKQELTTQLFSATNTPLIRLFSMLGPAVLRIGGATVDLTGWNGISNTTPITPSEVDSFAKFVRALPSDWSVLYGINLKSNTPENAADEAAYAAKDLGRQLRGFELGNEPEFYSTYNNFLYKWNQEENDMVSTVPGWNRGIHRRGWILDGADAGQGVVPTFTDPFARDESSVASLLTQHYYVGSNGTMQTMLQYPNPTLDNLVTNIVQAAQGNQMFGARISECGSFSRGGILGVSNSLGAALWSLDFMFTIAEDGGQGVNFHGGDKSPYSPINNNGTTITAVGPEFYAMKLFSLIPKGGSVVPATVSLDTNASFTAYGVRGVNRTITALLSNKEVNDTISASVNLGPHVSRVALISLTAPNLFDSTGLMLGGATINTNGTWFGHVQAVLPATDGQLTVRVPPTTAYLLVPLSFPGRQFDRHHGD